MKPAPVEVSHRGPKPPSEEQRKRTEIQKAAHLWVSRFKKLPFNIENVTSAPAGTFFTPDDIKAELDWDELRTHIAYLQDEAPAEKTLKSTEHTRRVGKMIVESVTTDEDEDIDELDDEIEALPVIEDAESDLVTI